MDIYAVYLLEYSMSEDVDCMIVTVHLLDLVTGVCMAR